MTDHAKDFLNAAKRQKKIEDHVQQHGEQARAGLERQAILDQGGAAAARLLEQEEKQRKLDALLALAEDEVGQIIRILEGLPQDSAQRRFVITRDQDIAMGGSVTIRAHYATAEEAKEGLTFCKEDKPGFRLWFSGSSFSDDKTMYFYDYSRLIKDGSTYPDPSKAVAADGEDLRALIGAFVAHVASHRIDEIAAALQPAPQAPAALSESMVLHAPRLPARRTHNPQ